MDKNKKPNKREFPACNKAVAKVNTLFGGFEALNFATEKAMLDFELESNVTNFNKVVELLGCVQINAKKLQDAMWAASKTVDLK